MNMTINYVPLEPLPNLAPRVQQTYALPMTSAPQTNAPPTDPASTPVSSEETTSPTPQDFLRGLRHHRISITCCICLYLFFAYGLFLFFGETHHGFETFMSWCMFFCVCVLLAFIWDVKPPQDEELPAPATLEPERRTKGQMFAASFILVQYVWLLYWAVGTFKSWLLFLAAETWLVACAAGLIELWMIV